MFIVRESVLVHAPIERLFELSAQLALVTLPFGPLGRVVARLLLRPTIRRLCRKRFALLKELAEGEGWRRFVGA
jgi:hypothetical protein